MIASTIEPTINNNNKKLSYVQPDIDPLDDYDEYVNGIWTNTAKLPNDQSDWGSFNILHEENINKIKIILNELSLTNHKYHILGKFYKSCLTPNKESDDVIKQKISNYLNLVNLITNIEDVGIVIGFLTKIGINAFFNVSASEDPINTEIVKLTLSNIDLSLPDKKYYFDEKFKTYAIGFKTMITELFKYFGFSHTDYDYTGDVFDIEECIAIILKPIEERRELDKLYAKKTVNEFINSMTNTVDNIFQTPNGEKLRRKQIISNTWKNFFIASDLNIVDLIVYDISYFKKITILFQLMPIHKIKNYLKYILIRFLGKTMIDELDRILFDFFGRILHGQPMMMPRSTNIVNYLSKFSGEILGKEYINQFSDSESFHDVKTMIKEIQMEMKMSITNSSWLENATKQEALCKLKKITIKIGHPEVWRDHTALINNLLRVIGIRSPNDADKLIDPSDLFNMSICMRMYDYKINVIDVVDKPKNPNKWSMNVYDVNAYYDPQRNEIVFPAGIIQKPFFEKNQSIFTRYGALGVVIGHEIIHGYDDQGRKYNALGNIKNWWTANDLKKFNEIADNMQKQYSNYSINGNNVNGLLTLGENLADLGGITLALRAAIRVYNSSHTIIQQNQNDINNKREFFTSFAGIWKRITRPEKILERLMSDPHSPNKYRIFILRNIDEFYEAYKYNNIGKASNQNKKKMYLDPKLRIKMW
jgi:putative endopeptidase